MKIKSLISNIGAATIAALSLVGCSDYDNGYTEQQLNFIQGFKDVFGEIDHSNDWNLAERGSVTVTTSQPSRIKIYTNSFGTYKLVGDYENVNGTQTLGFDMVEGTKNILVSNGQVAQRTKVGDVITFASTRYTYTGDETEQVLIDGEMVDIVQTEDDFTKFGPEYIDAVLFKLPEEETNIDNVINNFSYISEGQFVIYPIYAKTSSSHILGIYWQEPDGTISTQRVYRTHTGEGGAGASGDEYELLDPDDAEKGCLSKGVIINLPVGTQFGFYLEVYKANGDETWPFTFWHCLYSEAELNEKMTGMSLDGRKPHEQTDGKIKDNGFNYHNDPVFGGTFATTLYDNERNENVDVTFLCFEDWAQNGPDFNDLVFAFMGAEPLIVDANAEKWILSCEDLGASFDLDYNDVVLEVEHISGREYATVTPLAAGGTLASYIYFNGTNGTQSLGEIHSYFGQEEKQPSGSYTPVNVNATKPTTALTKSPAKIDVTSQWSLSSFLRTSNEDMAGEMTGDDEKKKTMGGFYIKVLPQDATDPNGDYDYPIIQNEVVQSKNNVPYIICTPSVWNRPLGDGTNRSLRGDYRWPQEHVSMFKWGEFEGAAYNYNEGDDADYSFESWLKGVNKATSNYWYRYPYSTGSSYPYSYPNTCARNTPQYITTDADGDNSGYDDIVKKDPGLQITNLEFNNEDGYYNLQFSPDSETDTRGFRSYTIMIKSKSSVNPTPKSSGDGNLWVEGSVSFVEFKAGYYIWTALIQCTSDIFDEKEIVFYQEAGVQYDYDEIKIKVSNSNTSSGTGGNGEGETDPDKPKEDKYTAEYGSKYNVSDQYNCHTFKANTIKETAPVKVSFIIEGDYYSGYGEYKDFIVTWNNNQSWTNNTECETTVETISETSPTYTVLSTVLTADDLKDLDYIGTSIYHGGTCVGAYVKSTSE